MTQFPYFIIHTLILLTYITFYVIKDFRDMKHLKILQEITISKNTSVGTGGPFLLQSSKGSFRIGLLMLHSVFSSVFGCDGSQELCACLGKPER